MRFSLRSLLYVVALLAICLGVFGVWGLFVAALVAAFWGARRGIIPNTGAEISLGIIAVLVGLLLPHPPPGNSHARRAALGRLRSIAQAARDYESQHGHLPPATTWASDGTPLHSWRTLLWPQLDQQQLYSQVKPDEPWDSVHNQGIAVDTYDWQTFGLVPDSPSSGRHTSILAVVDPALAFLPDRPVSLSDVTDGVERTIGFIEVERSDIDIMQPRDLSLDEAIDLLVGDPAADWTTTDDYYYWRQVYRHRGNYPHRVVAFLDATPTLLYGCDPADARALLTRSGGESIAKDPQSLKRNETITTLERIEPRWQSIIGSIALGTIVVLPWFWNRLRRESTP